MSRKLFDQPHAILNIAFAFQLSLCCSILILFIIIFRFLFILCFLNYFPPFNIPRITSLKIRLLCIIGLRLYTTSVPSCVIIIWPFKTQAFILFLLHFVPFPFCPFSQS